MEQIQFWQTDNLWVAQQFRRLYGTRMFIIYWVGRVAQSV